MLTTRGRYAVMAIVDVAARGSNETVKLSAISESQDIPLNYLEQIFLRLRRANIVSSVKGPGGGYVIIKEANQISVMNIIDAVDENIKMTRCGNRKFCMKSGQKCDTHDLWKGLGHSIREYLSSISIQDILTNKITV